MMPSPAQVGKLFRVGVGTGTGTGTAALPSFPVRHRPPLHLTPTATAPPPPPFATPARCRRRHALISRPPRLSHSLSLHPPARLPATLRAAAATSFLAFQVSGLEGPSPYFFKCCYFFVAADLPRMFRGPQAGWWGCSEGPRVVLGSGWLSGAGSAVQD